LIDEDFKKLISCFIGKKNFQKLFGAFKSTDPAEASAQERLENLRQTSEEILNQVLDENT